MISTGGNITRQGSFVVSAVIVVAILLYFPNRPPNAPSITATVDRTDFRQGVSDLFRHRNWWLLATACESVLPAIVSLLLCISIASLLTRLTLRILILWMDADGVMTGISSAWQSILALDLQPIFYDAVSIQGCTHACTHLTQLRHNLEEPVTQIWRSLACTYPSTYLRYSWSALESDVALSLSLSPSLSLFLSLSLSLFACQGACFPIFYEMGEDSHGRFQCSYMWINKRSPRCGTN
eukprot:COSAG02_NODE_8023_length_2743_cov_1.909228_5_plen_238_part_00